MQEKKAQASLVHSSDLEKVPKVHVSMPALVQARSLWGRKDYDPLIFTDDNSQNKSIYTETKWFFGEMPYNNVLHCVAHRLLMYNMAVYKRPPPLKN